MFTAPWDNADLARLDCGKGNEWDGVDVGYGNRRQMIPMAVGGGDGSRWKKGMRRGSWGRFALIRAGKEISAAECSGSQERCVQFTCSIISQHNFRDGDRKSVV